MRSNLSSSSFTARALGVPVDRRVVHARAPRHEVGTVGSRSQRAESLRVLADEAQDPGPVPERAAREPPLVGLRLVLVAHDRLRDVPALPAGARRAVLQVDVLAVEAEALVEPAELLEHLAPQEQEGA